MKTHIIAFVAPKGYGKTTACNIIKEHYQADQINFKDALVFELYKYFPELLAELAIVYNMTVSELFIKKPPAMRALMRDYGTGVVRSQNPDHWVMNWKLALVDRINAGATLILNDDTRFQNEYEAVKAYGGTLIRIERTDMQSTDTHQSETEQRGFECDYVVTTSEGNQQHFAREILEIVKKVVVQ